MPHRTIAQVLRDQHLCHLTLEDTVRTAATEMSRRHIAAIIVMNGDGALKGIFTERDVLDRVLVPGRDPDTTTLAEVMTPSPLTIDVNVTIRHALNEMRDAGLRHMPVTRDGTVVGVVSIRDFIGDEIAELDHEREFAKTVWEGMR